jgi:arsenate reductase
MAEGFLRELQGETYEVHSAGMEPKAEVHPMAVRVMQEIGIDISSHRTKSTREYLGTAPVKHLLIVCSSANQTCPRIWPGSFTRTYLPFDDPAEFGGSEEEILAQFRRVRDEIGAAMKTWKPERLR